MKSIYPAPYDKNPLPIQDEEKYIGTIYDNIRKISPHAPRIINAYELMRLLFENIVDIYYGVKIIYSEVGESIIKTNYEYGFGINPKFYILDPIPQGLSIDVNTGIITKANDNTDVPRTVEFTVRVTVDGGKYSEHSYILIVKQKYDNITIPTTKPIIQLHGNNPTEIEKLYKYSEQGASCKDVLDFPVPIKIIKNTEQNKITYSGTDIYGNNADPVIRNINKINHNKPVIILQGNTTFEVSENGLKHIYMFIHMTRSHYWMNNGTDNGIPIERIQLLDINDNPVKIQHSNIGSNHPVFTEEGDPTFWTCGSGINCGISFEVPKEQLIKKIKIKIAETSDYIPEDAPNPAPDHITITKYHTGEVTEDWYYFINKVSSYGYYNAGMPSTVDIDVDTSDSNLGDTLTYVFPTEINTQKYIYNEPGYSAIDENGIDITDRVKIEKSLRSDFPYLYNLDYGVIDDRGLTGYAKREIKTQGNSVTNTPPIINLTNYDPNVIPEYGIDNPYVEPGYQAIDIEDGDITAEVVITMKQQDMITGDWIDIIDINYAMPTQVKIIYTITDNDGNSVEAIRTIKIKEQDPV